MFDIPNLKIRDVALGFAILYTLQHYISHRTQGKSKLLPPGPTGYPLIGNIFDVPSSYPWLAWAKYKEKYGGVASLRALGSTFIIVNDQKAAWDFCERGARASVYVDRPVLCFAKMAGWGDVMSLLQYDESYILQRKHMHRFIGTSDAITKLHPAQHIETKHFIQRILADSSSDPGSSRNRLHDHIRHLAGATILKVSHGYTVDTSRPDPLVKLADEAIEEMLQASLFAKSIVNVFPVLQYLPDWFPGTGFKKVAKEYRKKAAAIADVPHLFVKRRIAEGTALPSYDAAFLEQEPTPQEEHLLKHSATSMYAGGSDTSVAAVYSFFLAMQLFPEVQKSAQAEVDAVVGDERLPTFKDRVNLPYVDAMVKEVLRWHTFSPLCIPHVAKEDGEYEGYFIPKGAAIVPNLWAIMHDPDNFPEPFEFKPERFLSTDGHVPESPDPKTVVFGYGRRTCPGKQLADSTIFIAIAMCLATLDISMAKDEKGMDIVPKYEMTDAFISHPKPFPYTITPRSSKAKDLILSTGTSDGDEAANVQQDSETIYQIYEELAKSAG